MREVVGLAGFLLIEACSGLNHIVQSSGFFGRVAGRWRHYIHCRKKYYV